MKKLLYIFFGLFAATLLVTSCGDDEDNLDYYRQWQKDNLSWMDEQRVLKNPDGTLFYNEVTAPWNSGIGILIHYFNDRSLTAGNLRPLYTSVVQCKYRGELYNGFAFDSSYTAVDSLFVTAPANVVPGFALALTDMHVGDSARVIIPFWAGYGATASGTIPPYSNLVFDIALKNILDYEKKP